MCEASGAVFVHERHRRGPAAGDDESTLISLAHSLVWIGDS
ncbi:hypothetical protein ABH922_000042 [Rhodococcus sp. 27YEA15]